MRNPNEAIKGIQKRVDNAKEAPRRALNAVREDPRLLLPAAHRAGYAAGSLLGVSGLADIPGGEPLHGVLKLGLAAAVVFGGETAGRRHHINKVSEAIESVHVETQENHEGMVEGAFVAGVHRTLDATHEVASRQDDDLAAGLEELAKHVRGRSRIMRDEVLGMFTQGQDEDQT